MNFLAMDLGATTVKYALVDEKGVLSYEGSLITASKDAEELLEKISVVAKDYLAKYQISGLGLSCAGVVHPHEGRMLGASFNMPKGWYKADMKTSLEKLLGIPVVAENDVNSAALAELWLGAGRKLHNFICIAMGTGIGSGIVLDKKLYYGAGYKAGEIGYIHSNRGSTMYWERMASTLALVRRVKDYMVMNRKSDDEIENVDGSYVFEQAAKDSTLASILDDWAENLAKGIVDAAYILNPEAVILGGGVSAQGKRLLDLVEPHVRNHFAPGFGVEVLIAEKGNDAGKLGVVKRLLDDYFPQVKQ